LLDEISVKINSVSGKFSTLPLVTQRNKADPKRKFSWSPAAPGCVRSIPSESRTITVQQEKSGGAVLPAACRFAFPYGNVSVHLPACTG
jgi:hypothetical protein